MKTVELTCKVCHKPIIVGQMAVEVHLFGGTIIVHSRTGTQKNLTCLEELKTVVDSHYDYPKQTL